MQRVLAVDVSQLEAHRGVLPVVLERERILATGEAVDLEHDHPRTAAFRTRGAAAQLAVMLAQAAVRPPDADVQVLAVPARR